MVDAFGGIFRPFVQSCGIQTESPFWSWKVSRERCLKSQKDRFLCTSTYAGSGVKHIAISLLLKLTGVLTDSTPLSKADFCTGKLQSFVGV